MTRAELVEAIYKELGQGILRTDIRKAVDAIFDDIAGNLAKGGRVEIRGFGSFSVKRRDARTGRNPRTGEVVDIPETHHVYFRSGRSIRDKLNGREPG